MQTTPFAELVGDLIHSYDRLNRELEALEARLQKERAKPRPNPQHLAQDFEQIKQANQLLLTTYRHLQLALDNLNAVGFNVYVPPMPRV